MDILTDYGGDGAAGDPLDPLQVEALTHQRTFEDDALTSGRVISQLAWCKSKPELCYAAYGSKQAGALNDSEGIVIAWNSKFKLDTPEFVFKSPSAVTSMTLCPYNPNIVIGGTYSGQVVIWDNRSRKRSPVQRSKYGQKTHTHPVFCLDVIWVRQKIIYTNSKIYAIAKFFKIELAEEVVDSAIVVVSTVDVVGF